MRRPSLPLVPLLVTLALAAIAPAQERLTLDDVTGPELRDALSTPDYVWLDDGSALLYDKRRPANERTLERLDPTTGVLRPAVDRGRALTSLAPLMDGADGTPPASLGWPLAIQTGGRSALYELDDDLFLLDLRGSSFRRLTRTSEEEKNPTLAPDGSAVAFVRGSDLYLYDLGRDVERRLTSDGSETLLNGTLSWVYWEEVCGREDTATWWSPDSKALAFLQSDDAPVAESVSPLYEPATPKVVRQRYPKAGSANPEVRLGIVELASGAITWVSLGDPPPEYVVRVHWLPDAKRLAVQTLDRLQQRLELRFANRADGTSRVVLTETSKTSLTTLDDFRLLAGGARFLWSSEREGFARFYLYRGDGTLERPLSPPDLVLRPASGLDKVKGSVVAVDETRGFVYYTACAGSPVAPALYRCSLDGTGNLRLSQEPGTHKVGFDHRAERYLDRFANVATPPGLSLHRAADGALLATVAPPAVEVVQRYGVQTPELITYSADDGLRLPAQVMRPRGFDPNRKYPVILEVYGGPSAPTVTNDWQRDTLLRNILLDMGYVCVSADNRSATARSRALADTSYGKLFASLEVPDILAFVRWLKAQPWVDPARVGVWGWSGGGSFTLHLMTRSKEFRAGIAVAPVSDFRYYDSIWTEAFLGLPDANPEGYRAAAAATYAKDLAGRLLLVHGTADDNVHPQNTWRFARELVDAGIPFDMMVYPLEKHSITGARKHLFATMHEFWKRWL
jgi:dipeptidyl-peptidase 4